MPMSNELNNILNNGEKPIDQQALLDYLNNQLAGSELHDVEKALVDDPFLQDAMEGLQQMSPIQLQHHVDNLHRDLQKQVAKKKVRKNKRRFKDQPWLYLAVMVFLLLVVICYWVMHRYL